MRYWKQAPGLFVTAVLGVLVLAGSARAATPGFLIGGNAVEALKATFEIQQVGVSTFYVIALNFELNCQKLTTQVGIINSNSDAEGKFLYEECTSLNFATLKELPCVVIASATDSKPHVTATALVLPAEFKNNNLAILAENVKALILFKSGTGCPLPLDNTVTGELCMGIDGNDTVKPLILSHVLFQGECKARSALNGGSEINSVMEAEKKENEAVPTAFLDQLLYGTREAFVAIGAHVFLTGSHNGQTFGVSLY